MVPRQSTARRPRTCPMHPDSPSLSPAHGAGVTKPAGGFPMETPDPTRRTVRHVSRREVLTAGLAAGATLSAGSLHRPPALWGAEAGPPKRGGILRVWGYDPPHF